VRVIEISILDRGGRVRTHTRGHSEHIPLGEKRKQIFPHINEVKTCHSLKNEEEKLTTGTAEILNTDIFE